MRHLIRLSHLLVVAGLAGCAAKAPPLAPPLPPATAPPLAAPAPQPAIELPAPRPEPAVPPQASADAPLFTQTGLASFYGRAHAGKRTANGQRFDHHDFTAAHRTLAFGTLVRVTNLTNGRTVTVEITDRGPHVKRRIIDVSLAAARALHMEKRGVARVRLEAFRIDQASRDPFPEQKAR